MSTPFVTPTNTLLQFMHNALELEVQVRGKPLPLSEVISAFGVLVGHGMTSVQAGGDVSYADLANLFEVALREGAAQVVAHDHEQEKVLSEEDALKRR